MTGYLIPDKNILLPNIPGVISDFKEVREFLHQYRIVFSDFMQKLIELNESSDTLILSYDRDNSNNHTSGTGEDDLASTTIEANILGTNKGIDFFATGNIANENSGDKTLNLYFGSSFDDTVFVTSDGPDWYIAGKIFNTAVAAQRIFWIVQLEGSTPSIKYTTATEDSTTDLILKLTGECSDAGDTLQQKMWEVRLIT